MVSLERISPNCSDDVNDNILNAYAVLVYTNRVLISKLEILQEKIYLIRYSIQVREPKIKLTINCCILWINTKTSVFL